MRQNRTKCCIVHYLFMKLQFVTMKTFTKMSSSRVSDGTVVHLSSKASSLKSSMDTEKLPSSVFRVMVLGRERVDGDERPWLAESNRRLPDVHSDHVFSVGLLDHVVDGITAHKRDVYVVSGYDL